MRLDSRLLPALFGAIVVIAACSDSTRPRLQSPLVGQWELTTHFDTFSFETGAPSPPDCVYANMYCTHFRATTDGAYLAGMIDLRDTSSSTDSVTKTVLASGTLQGSFCDTIDRTLLTGCTHVSDRTALEYIGVVTGVPDSTLRGSLDIVLKKPDDTYGLQQPVVATYSGTYAGDSIYGPIYWATSGRSPPAYRGTFVMRRVH